MKSGTLRAKPLFPFVLCAWMGGFGIIHPFCAEKPTLEHIYPTAAAKGSTNTVTLSGKFEPWPPKIWTSLKGVEFSFPTNKGSVNVTVEPDATVGPGLVRLYNDEGASDVAIFVVSELPHITDIEPNNQFAKAQPLTNFPATVNGRLDKNNDVDSFAFSIRAGQWLDAKLKSHTLMSRLDAVLRLVTTNGFQLAWNHDFDSLDPRLVWQAPYDLDLILQVFGFAYPAGSEIMLSGGNGGVYQLQIEISNEPPRDLSGALTENGATNSLPISVTGTIHPAGDEDSFAFRASKDEWIEFRVDAMSLGSDLDPWMKIVDGAGAELARNDDAENTRDAWLEWKATADGEFRLIVGSLTHQNRPEWRYKVTGEKVFPTYKATLTANSIVLESTGTNELKISTRRIRGFTNELIVAVESLPPGVELEPVKVEAKSNEATLKLITKDTAAFNGPIKVVVKDSVSNEDRPAFFELVSRTENNGVPGGYSKLLVEETADLWLTIKSKPAK